MTKNTPITLTHIQKLATLTKLAVTPEDAIIITERVSNLLTLIETMQAVDTEGVAPLTHPTTLVNEAHEAALRLRDDVTIKTVSDETAHSQALILRELRMRNAPVTENGYFLVPRVLE